MVTWESRLDNIFQIPQIQALKAWRNPQLQWIDLLRYQLSVGEQDLRVWASIIYGIQTLKISFSYVKVSCVAAALNGHQ